MARGFQGAMLRGFGARDHTATVIETVQIAPHFVRIRMESATLFDEAQAEPAAWLRFWFPDPEGSKTEFQRAYTISEADVPAGRFAVDIVLHDSAGGDEPTERTTTTDHFGDFRFSGLTEQTSTMELRVRKDGNEKIIATRERIGSVNLGTLLC